MAMISLLCPSCNKENCIDSKQEHFYCTYCGKRVLTEAALAYSAVIQKSHTDALTKNNAESKRPDNSKSISGSEDTTDIVAESLDSLEEEGEEGLAEETPTSESSNEAPSKKNRSSFAKSPLGWMALLAFALLVILAIAFKACESGVQHNTVNTAEAPSEAPSESPTDASNGERVTSGVLMPEQFRGTHVVTGARISTDSSAPHDAESFSGMLEVGEDDFSFSGSVNGVMLELSGVALSLNDDSSRVELWVSDNAYKLASLGYTRDYETKQLTDNIVLIFTPESKSPETPFAAFYFN